jgi:hypothetical protein
MLNLFRFSTSRIAVRERAKAAKPTLRRTVLQFVSLEIHDYVSATVVS